MNARLRRYANGGLLCAVGLMSAAAVIAQDGLKFSFGWPADLSANVEFEASRTQVAGDRTANRSVAGTYQMSTARVSDGIRVSFDDFSVEPSKSQNETQAKLQDFMASVGSFLPHFVVSPEGKLLRLEGVTELRRNAITAFDEVSIGLSDDLRARLDRTLNTLISDVRLKASIQSYWQRDVGAWMGRNFVLGKTISQERTQPIGMLQNAQLPMKTSITVQSLRPCQDGMAADSCAVVNVISELKSGRLTPELAARVRQAISGAPADFQLDSVDLTSSLDLVTEPSTLLPHKVVTERTLTIYHTYQDKKQQLEQIEKRETRYQYTKTSRP